MGNSFVPLSDRRRFEMCDVREPELYREQFPYTEVPRILFDGTDVLPNPPRLSPSTAVTSSIAAHHSGRLPTSIKRCKSASEMRTCALA